jgi:riboflavin synthase
VQIDMFSGLITQTGKVTEQRATGNGAVLTVSHGVWDTPVEEGESIAVQGVCLTVTGIEGGRFRCDVLEETLNRSNLGRLAVGSAVNLERALRLGDRLGGHLVSGHIDGVGVVERVAARGRDHVLAVAVEAALARDMVLKGSVAVDGVSLTISALEAGRVEVNLAPFTWTHTTLGGARAGDRVNIETDMIGKYVRRHLEGRAEPGPASDAAIESALRRAGFG